MKLLKAISALVAVLAIFASCNNTAETEPIPVTDITVTPTSMSLGLGQTAAITVTYIPENATTGKSCTFSCDNPSVATVDANGVVTAAGVGNANIWIVSGSILKICPVSVQKDPKITSIIVVPTQLDLLQGGFAQVVVQKLPADATETITCVSDNPSVATGTVSGLIQAIGLGETTIHFKSANCDAALQVKVVKDNITSITITPSTASVSAGGTFQFSAVTVPSGATGYSWSSDDETVATIDATGKVTGIKVGGTTTIHAKSSKCDATAVVTVTNDDISSLTLAPKNNYVYEGSTVQLGVTTVPEKSSETISWSSDNASIATVSQTGLVTGVAEGVTTVRASSKYCSDQVTVNVMSNKISSISLSPTSLNLSVNQTGQISAQTFPAGATETIQWSSSDSNVASVDANGLVTAKSNGFVTITAKSSQAEATAAVSVYTGIYAVKVDALTKVVNNQKYSENNGVIRVARGETATVQVCIEAPTGASNLSAQVLDLTMGGVTPKLYWEREILCTSHWDQWAGGKAPDEINSAGNMYFDPLMPMDQWNPGSIASGARAALWCEIAIPRTMAAGTYTGKIKVTGTYSGGAASCEAGFTIQVYNVTLPEKLTLNADNWTQGGFWQVNNGSEPDTDGWFEIQGKLVEFMNDYHQTTYKLEQGTRRTYNPSIDAKGKVVYDFSMIKREIELYDAKCKDFRHFRGEDIAVREQDYPWLLAMNLCYNNNGKASWKYLNNGEEDAVEAKKLLQAYITELYSFLSSNTLSDGRKFLDVYILGIVDEAADAQAESYNTVASWVKQVAPDLKIGNAIETANISASYLDFPCPTESAIENNRAKGNQVQWMYICEQPQGNYANRFIRIPLIKARLVHWCNYYYNAPNYLHWALKSWSHYPYTDDAYCSFIGGDEWIIYPGTYRSFNPSIRLCAMRDGMYDFELLTMLNNVNPTKAQEILGKVVKGPANYDTDVAHFRQYRQEILEALAQ